MELLQCILLGIMGIAFYSLWRAKDYMTADKWHTTVFINDNKGAWVWSCLVIIAFAITLYFEPKAGDLLKTFTGVDLINTPMGFISLGLVLCGLVKK